MRRLVPRTVLEPRDPVQLDLWEREARCAVQVDRWREYEREREDHRERRRGGLWQEAAGSGLAEEVIRDARLC